MRFVVVVLVVSFSIFCTELRAESILQQNPNLSTVEGDLWDLDKFILKSSTSNPLIIGGYPMVITDSPWQVALIYSIYSEPYRVQFCGGSILSEKWVVTAAHCVRSESVKGDGSKVDIIANTTQYQNRVQFRGGCILSEKWVVTAARCVPSESVEGDESKVDIIANTTELHNGVRVKVKDIYTHPGYSQDSYDYDIALLRLDETSAKLSTIQRASESLIVVPAQITVSGWGATKEGSLVGSGKLMGVDIPLVTNKTCNASYNDTITPRMFCAGKQQGGLDACQGDSGGPAVFKGTSGKVLLGIISNGIGCAEPGKYGIYTDVRSVRDWLDAQMAAVP